jgi:hypothetical protein
MADPVHARSDFRRPAAPTLLGPRGASGREVMDVAAKKKSKKKK